MSAMAASGPNAGTGNKPPKSIICCFDGTGNKFGDNSNIVRLFSALVKDRPKEQVVYYQPGIGTYSNHQYYTWLASQIATKVDQGIAWYLNDHVKEGYKFIMQHYKKGDKICLFGFSRGAYTARVLMGMLYKVGLLPKDNIEQVDFAYSIYETTGEKGKELSREFKKTFAIPVTIEFVGVWDTVSSVGIYPRGNRHPYTSVNYATKHFRHALALDERRIRFRPQTWYEATVERELDLDVDDPAFPEAPSDDDDGESDYKPPTRNVADVKEVWFSGCHADIGGGSHHNRVRNSLSFIPLRWMICEIEAANCGIIFDEVRKKAYMRKRPMEADSTFLNNVGITPGAANKTPSLQTFLIPRYTGDIIATMYDQLILVWYWWFLETFPLLTTYQTLDGNWIRKKVRNLGDGRRIPFNPDGMVLVHNSVEKRMKMRGAYVPQAVNWKALTDRDMDMVTYVSDMPNSADGP